MIGVIALGSGLIALSMYFAWFAISYDQAQWLLGTAILLVTGVGLLMRRLWSKYLFFVIAITTVLGWLYSIAVIVGKGWPEPDAVSTIVSLLPGAMLLAACVLGCIIVQRNVKG